MLLDDHLESACGHFLSSTEFINTREEGKTLIKEIALKRIECKGSVAAKGLAGTLKDADGIDSEEPKQVGPLAYASKT